jgi:hypothetical protein
MIQYIYYIKRKSLEIFDIDCLKSFNLFVFCQACPIGRDQLFGLGIRERQFVEMMPFVLRMILDLLGNFSTTPHKQT